MQPITIKGHSYYLQSEYSIISGISADTLHKRMNTEQVELIELDCTAQLELIDPKDYFTDWKIGVLIVGDKVYLPENLYFEWCEMDKQPQLSDTKNIKRCYWVEYIYNAYEPDNKIVFYGLETTPGRFVANEMSFVGNFNDGYMRCAINCTITAEGNVYKAVIDEKEALFNSFEEAFSSMPGYLTHPDHSEDSEIIVHED